MRRRARVVLMAFAAAVSLATVAGVRMEAWETLVDGIRECIATVNEHC